MIRVVCPLLIGGIFVATTIGDIINITKEEDPAPWEPVVTQWGLLLILLIISIALMLYKRDKEVIEA